MVKKTYTTPATLMLIIASKGMVATSPNIYTSEETVDANDVEVKGYGQSTHSYNVWDDDWSK